MADNKFPGEFDSQDPLEKFLDEETDEEFGLPEFKEHFADSLTPAVLKDWTAADFASIYVRFRPHLERHARRFLVNPSQVEEVVQDAFLYLMTTLPELDSELGVLKFLKWKTRLLALDVIRANSRASFAPINEQPEFVAKGEELSADLERADDAAIVALAMAKLQPRHREALIATLYEEKSNEVVAAQMGLNENAFRQLLFRARSAFKKALVGEAETAGKSVSEILSIAARKAAKESGKYISAAGAFLLVLAISIGVIPNLSQPAQEQFAAEVAPAPVAPVEAPEQQIESAPEAKQVTQAKATETSAVETVAQSTQVQGTSPVVSAAVITTATPESVSSSAQIDEERQLLEEFMNDALNSQTVQLLSKNTKASVVQASDAPAGNLTLTNDSGLTAYLSYDLATEQGIQYSWFSIEVGGNEFVAVPQAQAAQVIRNEDGSATLYFISTDLLIGDTSGAFDFIASDDSAVSTGALRIEINLDANGKVLDSTMSLTPRS